MTEAINIALPRFAKFGAGSIDELGSVVAQLGIARPVLVTDQYLTETGQTERLVKLLQAAGIEPAVFSETVPDPTVASLEDGLALVRSHGADGIIGFGGGSPMDTAKALAVISVSGGEIASFKAPSSYMGPALPIVAVPTSSGSGSEATQFTVITDGRTDEKMLCPGLSFLPIAMVVDFELTVSMPARLTADTGVDALTHAIEAYVSRRASLFTDALAIAAMRSISLYLRRAYADGADREAREAMMLASTQAGMAFSNSMLLLAVTEFSIDSAIGRYSDCAKAMGVVAESADDREAASALVAELRQLCADVEVPTPRSYGIDKADWEAQVDTMAVQSLASGSPDNNPRIPTREEIVGLYRQIF